MNYPAPVAVPKDSLCKRRPGLIAGYKWLSKKSRKLFSSIFRRGSIFPVCLSVFSDRRVFFIFENDL